MSMTGAKVTNDGNAFWSDESLPMRELVDLSGLSEAEVRSSSITVR